jgi:hypothetical protein
MGLDFVETSIELEKLFGVPIEVEDMRPVWAEGGYDCTAKDLHDLVVRKCRASGVRVPRSSWNRVRLSLARALGVSPNTIKPETFLKRELQFD